jgi:hypothetical protein
VTSVLCIRRIEKVFGAREIDTFRTAFLPSNSTTVKPMNASHCYTSVLVETSERCSILSSSLTLSFPGVATLVRPVALLVSTILVRRLASMKLGTFSEPHAASPIARMDRIAKFRVLSIGVPPLRAGRAHNPGTFTSRPNTEQSSITRVSRVYHGKRPREDILRERLHREIGEEQIQLSQRRGSARRNQPVS